MIKEPKMGRAKVTKKLITLTFGHRVEARVARSKKPRGINSRVLKLINKETT